MRRTHCDWPWRNSSGQKKQLDVEATISHNITTLYYFEIYLNQKVSIELAGPEDAEHSVAAVLSLGQCTDREDEAGYRGKGRLQTYKAQGDWPPGYDAYSIQSLTRSSSSLSLSLSTARVDSS